MLISVECAFLYMIVKKGHDITSVSCPFSAPGCTDTPSQAKTGCLKSETARMNLQNRPDKQLLNGFSPCCRLEFIKQRQEALIYVDLKYCIEVVGCDHLTCKAYDYNEFLIIKELS